MLMDRSAKLCRHTAHNPNIIHKACVMLRGSLQGDILTVTKENLIRSKPGLYESGNVCNYSMSELRSLQAKPREELIASVASN